MGKYQIVEKPQALPGVCMFSGKSDEKYYFDMARDFDFWGAVYIGASTIEELAHSLGWIEPSEVQSLQGTINRLQELLVAQTIRNDRLERGLNELRDAGFSFDSRNPVRTLLGDDSFSHLSDDAADEGGSHDEGENLGVGKGETPEQGNVEGVDDVHPNAESTRSPILGL